MNDNLGFNYEVVYSLTLLCDCNLEREDLDVS